MDNILSMKVCGNRRGIYTNPLNAESYIDITKSINYHALNMEGVRGGVVWRNEDGSYHVAQLSGYTYERGLFCDLYDENGKSETEE